MNSIPGELGPHQRAGLIASLMRVMFLRFCRGMSPLVDLSMSTVRMDATRVSWL
jgi:hypothetical protein